MPDYADSKHRPHAIHTGEAPETRIARGPQDLVVTLDNWPQYEQNMFASLYDALVSNWGERPSRTVDRPCRFRAEAYPEYVNHAASWEHKYGWCKLEADEQAYVESCFAGKTLQQALERLTFTFCVDGCTRAETHQIVRTRVGAGFMQHGGRDNDWRHRAWTMPETIARACDADYAQRGAASMAEGPGGAHPTVVNDRKVCVRDWAPLQQFVLQQGARDLAEAIGIYLGDGKALYAALVDAGIPWQDARRVLWMGTQTYIHCDYNYVALKGVLANRLEHIMDWEVNCVAQLMLREVRMKCPPIFGRYLGSHSDMAKQAKFAGLESWPPDGKWPNPFEVCATCRHPRKEHGPSEGTLQSGPPPTICHQCQRSGGITLAVHDYVPGDSLPRQHTADQMPYWVLTDAAMNGGPVEWLWTNGVYPHDREVPRG